MLQSVDRMMKVYFYFEEVYYQAEKNTSLKIIAYDILKNLLLKKEDLFVEFLSELTILIFRVKSSKHMEENEARSMIEIIQLVNKLDSQPSKIHIFNHYLKYLYINHMTVDNRQNIQTLK